MTSPGVACSTALLAASNNEVTGVQGVNSCHADCMADAECNSDVNSGVVCDDATRICHDGCRGVGGNTCKTGFECRTPTGELATTQDIAECKAIPAPVPNQVEGGSVEGGGFLKCGVSGPAGKSEPFALFFLAASAGMIARRRRRAP